VARGAVWPRSTSTWPLLAGEESAWDLECSQVVPGRGVGEGCRFWACARHGTDEHGCTGTAAVPSYAHRTEKQWVFFIRISGQKPRSLHYHKDQSNSLSTGVPTSRKQTKTPLKRHSKLHLNSKTYDNYTSQNYMFHSFSKPKKLIHLPLGSRQGSEASINLFWTSSG